MNPFRPPCWARALALIFLVCCGCKTTHTEQLDVTHEARDQVRAGVELDLTKKQDVQLDQHQLVTAGPGERVEETFTPDGGLATRTTTRWGGSTSENWLKSALNAEEQLHVDAGVELKHDENDKASEKEADKMAPSGGCIGAGSLWALALIGALLFAWRVLRPRA